MALTVDTSNNSDDMEISHGRAILLWQNTIAGLPFENRFSMAGTCWLRLLSNRYLLFPMCPQAWTYTLNGTGL